VPTASDRLLDLVKEQLTEERARKSSVEQRGVTVVTTSGTVVTLLFGITALATKAQNYSLPPGASISLGIAGALFVVAALCAIAINWAMAYIEVEVEGLRDLQGVDWTVDETVAAKAVAKAWTDVIEGARAKNNNKARILRVAMLIEALAFGAVTMGVLFVLIG
jgi:hypothetical protein